MEVVASLSQGRTAAAQRGLFTHKLVPVIFEPPCKRDTEISCKIKNISSQILAAPGQKGASEAWSVRTNGPPCTIVLWY